MNTKKIIAIVLILMLALPLAACGGGNNAPTNPPSNPPAETPGVTPGNDDPCPCCPNCNQEECVCEECGGNDEYDCVCAVPDLGGIWTISFMDVTDSSPSVGADGFLAYDITLSFVASSLNEGGFLGQYSGEGKMMGILDASDYEAMAGGLISLDSDWAGPIFPVSFEVIDSNSATPNGGDDPASLTPSDLYEKLIGHAKFSAAVDGTMGPSWYQENVLGTGRDFGTGSGFTLEVEMHILVYDAGTAILYMTVPGLTETLVYRGTITRE
ncbi:MAG: hypothetical protein FWG21_02180 [Oscillospiraceae bacterium]|nr:hypothetical protein [Oscillospiraceae bacterium]